jgi:hypothetical protein
MVTRFDLSGRCLLDVFTGGTSGGRTVGTSELSDRPLRVPRCGLSMSLRPILQLCIDSIREAGAKDPLGLVASPISRSDRALGVVLTLRS